jgi:hypothetical protein
MFNMRTVLMSGVLATALIATVAAGAPQYQTTGARPQAATANQWQLLAERTADRLTEHDTIVLQPPYENFRSLRFNAAHSAVHVKYFLATYDNGVVERIDVNEKVEKDSQSRAINLPNVGQKSLRKIEVWYDTSGLFHDRAKVSVFGMK